MSISNPAMSVEEVKVGNEMYVRWIESRYYSSSLDANYEIGLWQKAGWSFVKRDDKGTGTYPAQQVTFAQVTKVGARRPWTPDEPKLKESACAMMWDGRVETDNRSGCQA